MRTARTALVTVTSAALLASVTTLPTTAAQAKPPPASTMVTDWTTIALRTVYTEAKMPVPAGALYLGFTSLAVYDAVLDASKGKSRHGRASAAAAVAQAAHDVLAEYVPASTAALDADLAADLAALPDNRAKRLGICVGQKAADDLIASRVGDGRGAAITYDKSPATGIWRPTPPANAPMAMPWLGFVTPLLLDSPTQVHVDGPDGLNTKAYQADYEEVRTMGALNGPTRTAEQTMTARFFNSNAIVQYNAALVDYSTRHPSSTMSTARTFALVNASMADTLITTWRLKYDVGFWRPLTAIQEGDTDTNPFTVGDPTWQPFVDDVSANPPGAPVGTPAYPEYPSGHASATNAFTTSLALATGSRKTDLILSSAVTGTTRNYTNLAVLSRDAVNARIWLGIHFRDAMEDTVKLAQRVTRIVNSRLP